MFLLYYYSTETKILHPLVCNEMMHGQTPTAVPSIGYVFDKHNSHPFFYIIAEAVCFIVHRIENDKVEGFTITQSFNKQENWTKALKFTMCNLKWVLYWFVGNTSFQPLSTMAFSHAEVRTTGTVGAKQSSESRS